MTKARKIRWDIKRLQYVKTWQLLVILIIAGFVAATFLRLNNLGMVERREAVISADKVGDQTTIIERLADLQAYVSAHMNTDLGKGVYLEYSYTRDYQTWQENYYESNSNGNIYKKAVAACAPKFTSWSTAYVQCVASELAKYPSASTLSSDTSKPRVAAYIHNFTSPIWSPDFAGFSVLVCLALLLLIVVRVAALGVLRLILHWRLK